MKFSRIGASLVLLAAVGFTQVGCGVLGGSPTATFKTFFEALQKNDVATMKKNVSKSSIALGERIAKTDNKTLDAWVKENAPGQLKPNEKMPQIISEKINGDKATLEIKPEDTKDPIDLPFVKEDGAWKLDLGTMFGGAAPR